MDEETDAGDVFIDGPTKNAQKQSKGTKMTQATKQIKPKMTANEEDTSNFNKKKKMKDTRIGKKIKCPVNKAYLEKIAKFKAKTVLFKKVELDLQRKLIIFTLFDTFNQIIKYYIDKKYMPNRHCQCKYGSDGQICWHIVHIHQRLGVKIEEEISWQKNYNDEEFERLADASEQLQNELEQQSPEVPNLPSDQNYYIEKVPRNPGQPRKCRNPRCDKTLKQVDGSLHCISTEAIYYSERMSRFLYHPIYFCIDCFQNVKDLKYMINEFKGNILIKKTVIDDNVKNHLNGKGIQVVSPS